VAIGWEEGIEADEKTYTTGIQKVYYISIYMCVWVGVCVCKYCARGTAEIYVISRGSTHVSGESINSARAAFTLSRDASSSGSSIAHVYNTIYYTYPAWAGPENLEHIYIFSKS
jgi:hypothetical protein